MRNREKNKLLKVQIDEKLQGYIAYGQKKHLDKAAGRKDHVDYTKNKIYSYSTYNSYKKQLSYFADFCLEKGGRKLEDCFQYANAWLEKGKEDQLSVSTLKLRRSALIKLYQCDRRELIDVGTRRRKDITRSRGAKVRDKHFSEKNHADLIEFCRSTGLRRAELSALTRDKLIYIEGKAYIDVKDGTKGGRPRKAPVTGDIGLVERLMASEGDNVLDLVFPNVPNGADIHSYRADYAARVYQQHVRPLDSLKKTEKYYCRGDRRGVSYDRQALLAASRALGHNRINIVPSNYLHTL